MVRMCNKIKKISERKNYFGWEKKYEGYGYRINICKTNVLLSINIDAIGSDSTPCPEIKFIENSFRANFASYIRLEEDNYELFLKGVNNAYAFIKEANCLIEEFSRTPE